MKLTELDATLCIIADPGRLYTRIFDDALATAQGIMFECPKCHGHQIRVWFRDRGVPDSERPKPRWAASGTALQDLTLSPSINLVDDEGGTVACGWHGFVKDGEVTP